MNAEAIGSHAGFDVFNLIVGVFCAALAWVTVCDTRPPLEDVHWDSPVWLHEAKGYAQTRLISDLRHCGERFLSTRDRMGAKKAPDCFFQFSRLGHVVILGELTRFLGANTETVVAATFLYRFMLALSLALLAWLILHLNSMLSGRDHGGSIGYGLAISTFLFAASTLFQYLGSSLVSDVPSMLLVISACVAFVQGLAHKSAWQVSLSGFLGFAAYAIRLESVITYVLFLIALAYAQFVYQREQTWWRGYILAGIVAWVFYAAYLLYFYPLPSPLLYLANAGQVHEQYYLEKFPAGITFFMKAGGLLWIGFLLQLAFGRRSRSSVFFGVWLGLLIVPLAPWFFEHGPTQTRHYAFINLPLMALSALGWSAFFDRTWMQGRLRAMTLGLLTGAALMGFLSHAQAYSWTHHLWGMRPISQFLGLPKIEKVTFPLDEAVRLSEYVYAEGAPTVVFLSRHALKEQDFLHLLAYLGPAYRADADAIKFRESGPERAPAEHCAQLLPLPSAESALYYRGEPTPACAATLRASGIRMLRLSKTTMPLGPERLSGETDVLSLRHFTLSQLP